MKKNEKLRNEVLAAIKAEPMFIAHQITVEANGGIITLSGTVDSYVKKRAAEHVANKVAGVLAVIEKIQVKFGVDDVKTDELLAMEILETIKFNPNIVKDNINILVENGHVTLDGHVNWGAQKEEVERAIHHITGVRMITNIIMVRSEDEDEIEKAAIKNALLRNWAIDDQEIEISVVGNLVTLKGKVYSLYQSETAERIAWNIPGVCNVKNKLVIQYTTS